MRRTRRVTVLATAALLVHTRLHAQEIAAYERRLDSLAIVAARARAAVVAYDDSVRRAATRLDTVQAGALRILAEPSLAPMVKDVGRRVVDSLAPRLGAAMERLSGHTFAVRRYVPSPWEVRLRKDPEVLVASVSATGAETQRWRGPENAAAVEAALRDAALSTAFFESDRAFFGWMGSTVPTDSVHTSEWARHRLLLVSSPTSVGLRCYQGDLPACKLVLGIEPPTDHTMQWYDSAARRRLVQSNGATARRISGRATEACERGSDSACVALMRQFPPSAFPNPVHPLVRLGLVRYALSVGGAGATLRLLADNRAPAERIAAAANVPLDAVLQQWQRRVRDTRIPSRDLSSGIVWLTIVWVAGLGLLSTRSSRWR